VLVKTDFWVGRIVVLYLGRKDKSGGKLNRYYGPQGAERGNWNYPESEKKQGRVYFRAVFSIFKPLSEKDATAGHDGVDLYFENLSQTEISRNKIQPKINTFPYPFNHLRF
jgi:hypothetical protein